MSTVVDWPCEWQGIRWFSGPRISKVTRVLGRLASWDDEIWSTDDLGMGSTCFHESFRSDTFFQQIIYDSIYDDTLWYYDSIYDDTLVSLASSGNGRCWLRMSPVTERAAPSGNWQVWARSKRKFPDTAGLTNNSERGWRYFFLDIPCLCHPTWLKMEKQHRTSHGGCCENERTKSWVFQQTMFEYQRVTAKKKQ